MNNKAIIEFGFRRIWRILQISEGVIHLGLRPLWITPSLICRILHIPRKPNSIIYIGYYTVARRYEFYFRVAKQYFTNERSEWVKYCFCHEKIKFISSSRRVISSIYYIDMLMTAFLIIFRRFPKIFQNCSEYQTNFPEHFPRISENFRRCPKISEDCRRLPRKTRRCFDDTPTNSSTI